MDGVPGQVISVLITAVFGFFITWRMEWFKNELNKSLADYKTKSDAQLEMFKNIVKQISDIDQSRLRACDELSQILTQANDVVAPISLGIRSGIYRFIPDSIISEINTYVDKLNDWYIKNRFYMMSHDILIESQQYSASLRYFARIIRMVEEVARSTDQERHLAYGAELHKVSVELQDHETRIRHLFVDFFPTLTKVQDVIVE